MAGDDRPCCPASAAARVRQLVVGGHRVAIAQLDEILEAGRAVAGEGEAAVRRELLRLTKIYNYVPRSAEREYEEALFAEFIARYRGAAGGVGEASGSGSTGPSDAERREGG